MQKRSFNSTIDQVHHSRFVVHSHLVHSLLHDRQRVGHIDVSLDAQALDYHIHLDDVQHVAVHIDHADRLNLEVVHIRQNDVVGSVRADHTGCGLTDLGGHIVLLEAVRSQRVPKYCHTLDLDLGHKEMSYTANRHHSDCSGRSLVGQHCEEHLADRSLEEPDPSRLHSKSQLLNNHNPAVGRTNSPLA